MEEEIKWGKDRRKGRRGKVEERRDGEEEGEGGEEEKEWRIGFWNVAGLRNKDEDFWTGLRKWEVIVLLETWMNEKGWRGIKGKLPRGYVWGLQWAEKKNRKGKAMGEMVMGIKREIVEKGKRIETGKEGMIVGRVIVGEQSWRVVGVYVNGNMEETLRGIEGWVEERERGCIR